mgnify:CR=1 FL=1
MNIAIIEDEPAHSQLLYSYLNTWSAEKKIPVRCSHFPSAESFLFVWEEEKDFDLLFVDIQMKAMNGMELAKKIRRENEDIAIVFTTGTSDYLEEGYEVEAMYYLRKPVNPAKISRCMDKLVKRSPNTSYVLVHGSDETLRLSVRQITYLEAVGHGCLAEVFSRLGEKTLHPITESISEMEKLLAPHGFLKCHRSYLCNLSCIRQIAKTEITLDSGSVIPLSRRSYREVNQAFIRRFRKEKDYDE